MPFGTGGAAAADLRSEVVGSGDRLGVAAATVAGASVAADAVVLARGAPYARDLSLAGLPGLVEPAVLERVAAELAP